MPARPEEEWAYWDEKATELRRTQLATVQTSATKWSALMVTLLGVFGTVAFAGGLTSIDKLKDPFPLIVKVATTAAAVALAFATYFFTRAGGGLKIREMAGISASTVRDINTTGAGESLEKLKWGRRAAVVAGLLVFGGSALFCGWGKRTTRRKLRL
jgi:MFS family permease